MIARRYWKTIALSPIEMKAYRELIVAFSASNDELVDDRLVADILDSNLYSYDFKRKLVHRMSTLDSSRKWGLQNFNCTDLSKLVGRVQGEGMDFTEEDVRLLVANPDFFALSHDGQQSSFEYIFTSLGGSLVYQANVRDYIVKQIIDKDLMDLEIAEFALAFNDTIEDRYADRGVTLTFTNASPIIEWAREKYVLGDVPDSWVSKFILGGPEA